MPQPWSRHVSVSDAVVMGPSNVRSAHARQALPAAPAGDYVSLTVGKFIERTGHSTVSTSAAVALAGAGSRWASVTLASVTVGVGAVVGRGVVRWLFFESTE